MIWKYTPKVCGTLAVVWLGWAGWLAGLTTIYDASPINASRSFIFFDFRGFCARILRFRYIFSGKWIKKIRQKCAGRLLLCGSAGLAGWAEYCSQQPFTEAPQAKQVLEFSYWPTHQKLQSLKQGSKTTGPYLWVGTRGPYLGVCHPWVILEEIRGSASRGLH